MHICPSHVFLPSVRQYLERVTLQTIGGCSEKIAAALSTWLNRIVRIRRLILRIHSLAKPRPLVVWCGPCSIASQSLTLCAHQQGTGLPLERTRGVSAPPELSMRRAHWSDYLWLASIHGVDLAPRFPRCCAGGESGRRHGVGREAVPKKLVLLAWTGL